MQVKMTWLGTAAYILDLDGIKLMFDPFFYRQKNKDADPPLKTKREDIKDISGIFISHGHIDHITDAGWFAEKIDAPVYCSETSKENIIKWAKGEVIKAEAYELSDTAKSRIEVVEWGDVIEINKDISVEILKSRHIRFDANTIFARAKSKEFLKQLRSMARLGSLGMGKVLGFAISCKNKKFVSYGSLWHEYSEVLEKHKDCDVFIAPIAGNSKKNLAKKGGIMVDLLQPKIVIPIHWDNFFPPISRLEDIEPFKDYVKSKYPNTKILMPKMDESIILYDKDKSAE